MDALVEEDIDVSNCTGLWRRRSAVERIAE
jgi:hypothetical protein